MVPVRSPTSPNERRLRTSEAFVAGVAAMTVATALLGLVHIVQASFPFRPSGSPSGCCG